MNPLKISKKVSKWLLLYIIFRIVLVFLIVVLKSAVSSDETTPIDVKFTFENLSDFASTSSDLVKYQTRRIAFIFIKGSNLLSEKISTKRDVLVEKAEKLKNIIVKRVKNLTVTIPNMKETIYLVLKSLYCQLKDITILIGRLIRFALANCSKYSRKFLKFLKNKVCFAFIRYLNNQFLSGMNQKLIKSNEQVDIKPVATVDTCPKMKKPVDDNSDEKRIHFLTGIIKSYGLTAEDIEKMLEIFEFDSDSRNELSQKSEDEKYEIEEI